MFAHTMSCLPHLSPDGTRAATASGRAFCSPYATDVAVGAAAGVELVVDDPPPQPVNAAHAMIDATNLTDLTCCICNRPPCARNSARVSSLMLKACPRIRSAWRQALA